MLEKLYIENVAVIEKTEIEFTRGFNILTGETGAGKSIIIDSLNLLLGQRASRDMIRTGADRAFVAAVFSVSSSYVKSILEQYDITPDDDGNLFIERTFRLDGHGGAKINGRPVSLSVLKELSIHLVNIHGQHMNQRIMDPSTHVSYIDSYGDYSELLDEYQALYKEVTAARKELLRLKKIEQDRIERQEILSYRIHELEQARLIPGEEEELTERRNTAAHAEKITGALLHSLDMLSERENSAYDLFLQIQSELERVGQYSVKLHDVAVALAGLTPVIEESISTLRDAQNSMSYRSGELDDIEHRLGEIKRIKAKYGGSVDAALGELERAQAELDELEFSEENRTKQEHIFQKRAETLAGKASQLTTARKTHGERLAAGIMDKLAFLDMEKCRFTVNITPSEKYSACGHDVVEFFISANPGEPPKPLSKIASGGELSRIMLAIINVLSERECADTMIFDEVDSGVSGKTAQKIGVLLKAASKHSQVLCVTHLAQIAAMADNHLFIEKQTDNVRTYTTVTQLDAAGRRREVARIIGGVNITETTLKTADELIADGGI